MSGAGVGSATDRDPERLEDLRRRFAGWLAPRLEADGAVTVAPLRVPPQNGSSNQTLVVDARWEQGGRPQSGGFVVRMAPRGWQLFHHYDLEQQYRTMAALAATPVPVPPLVGHEPDPGVAGEPFYVMGKVEGDAPPDLPPLTVAGWVHDATPSLQSALHDAGLAMVARVHEVDPAILSGLGLPEGFADLLARTEAWYRWATGPGGHPVLDPAWAWLREHEPADPSPDVCNWGDARLGNLLFAGAVPVAVLDWEMAAVVPPEVDLGWWLFFSRFYSEGMGVPQLPGFPDDDAVVRRFAELTGRPVRHLHYYRAFAAFRFAIIFLRAVQARGDERTGIDNPCTRLLAADLGLPPPSAC